MRVCVRKSESAHEQFCQRLKNYDNYDIRFPTVIEILEKSWNFKIPFSRPGKVIKFSKFIESFVKDMTFDFVVPGALEL